MLFTICVASLYRHRVADTEFVQGLSKWFRSFQVPISQFWPRLLRKLRKLHAA
jgi:hypothetical protein